MLRLGSEHNGLLGLEVRVTPVKGKGQGEHDWTGRVSNHNEDLTKSQTI